MYMSTPQCVRPSVRQSQYVTKLQANSLDQIERLNRFSKRASVLLSLAKTGAMAGDFQQKRASCEIQTDQYPTLTRTGSTHDQVKVSASTLM